MGQPQEDVPVRRHPDPQGADRPDLLGPVGTPHDGHQRGQPGAQVLVRAEQRFCHRRHPRKVERRLRVRRPRGRGQRLHPEELIRQGPRRHGGQEELHGVFCLRRGCG